MNNLSNLSEVSGNSFQLNVLSFVRNIGYVYIVPPLCSIGFLLNILTIITFIRLCQQGNIFKYFLAKTVAENIVLFAGALIPLGNCVQCAVYQSVAQLIHQYIFVGYLIPVSYTFSGFCEIVITIDRIWILKNKNKNVISYKLIMLLILIISICMFIPLLFSRYIKQLPESKFILVRTSFGSTADYTIYLTTIVLVRNSLFFVSLFICNIILLIQFRKYINKKFYLVTGISKQSRSNDDASNKPSNSYSNENNVKNKKEDPEKKLTKMTLILGSIFIISRGLQSVSSISSSIDKGNQIKFNRFTIIYSFFSNILNYLVYSLSFFFHYYFNSSFTNEQKKIFKCFF